MHPGLHDNNLLITNSLFKGVFLTNHMAMVMTTETKMTASVNKYSRADSFYTT